MTFNAETKDELDIKPFDRWPYEQGRGAVTHPKNSVAHYYPKAVNNLCMFIYHHSEYEVMLSFSLVVKAWR